MKQVAEITGLGVRAIRDRRQKAAWVWACARNQSPNALRPSWIWLRSELERALMALPKVSSPALEASAFVSAEASSKKRRKLKPDATANNVTNLDDYIRETSAEFERLRERNRKKRERYAAKGWTL